MMNKRLLLPLLALSFVSAEIREVSQIEEVKKSFEVLTENDLAIFDIDMVLMQPDDPAFQMANMKKYGSVIKKVMQEIPAEKRDVFLNLITLNSDSILINNEFPSLLNRITAPKIALTANLTGKLGQIESMEEWKIERLRNLGIDFSKSTPFSEKIVFHHLPTFRGNFSLFTKGVLFANGSGASKGEALVEFLKITKYAPKKIVFIDDREDNVKSVEIALYKFDPSIEFQGLWFTGAKNFPSAPISEDQFEAKWLSISMQLKQIE